MVRAASEVTSNQSTSPSTPMGVLMSLEHRDRSLRLVVAVRLSHREVGRPRAAECGVRVQDPGSVVRVDPARAGVTGQRLQPGFDLEPVSDGHLFFTSAATPATMGAEHEVPVQYQ